MDPQPAQPKAPVNPLLAHLNDTDESHASTRVDFVHPGTTVQPLAKSPHPAMYPKAPAAEPEPPEVPVAPELPPTPPSPPTPPPPPPAPPKSPRNNRPIVVAVIVIVVLAALGGGAYWWFKIRKPTSSNNQNQTQQSVALTPVTPSNLTQLNSAGQTVAAAGSLKTPPQLNFTLTTTATNGTATPEVEVEPLGTAFTGKANYTGSGLTANGSALTAKVSVTDLKDGSYHWQARTSVGTSSSSWTPFGSDAARADFVVDSTPPKAAVVTSVGNQSVKAGAVSLATTTNPTSISGTADPGTAISVSISPDNQSATVAADASGKWTVTMTQGLANGDHTVTIAAADAAGNVTKTSFTISSNTAAAAPATQKVAATGDNTKTLTMIGWLLIVICSGGLILVMRRGQPRTKRS